MSQVADAASPQQADPVDEAMAKSESPAPARPVPEVATADVPPAISPPATTAAAPNIAAQTKPGQWTVPRAAGTCSVSGRAIAPGERYWAAVRENPAGIERLDVAAEHWDAVDRDGLLASWQTTMPVGEEKKKRFVDDDVLCTLFEKLGEATEPAKVNFRFVLGLILMRKRLVLYDKTRREPDGRDVWVVRMRGRQDALELVDPKLDADQTLEVSQQLGQVLNEEM
jgi:hypothetical protein